MTDEPITPPAPLAGEQIAQARAAWLSHGYPAEQFDAEGTQEDLRTTGAERQRYVSTLHSGKRSGGADSPRP